MNRILIILPTLLLLLACRGDLTPMNMTSAQNHKTKVKAFFTALENEDAEAVSLLFAEDGQHVNPYASGIFPEGAKGRINILNYWAPVFPNFDGMTFEIQELLAMENPFKVFVKFEGRIKLKGGAGIYQNQYYATFAFNEEGLITEYIEIFNPIVAARAFGLIHEIK